MKHCYNKYSKLDFYKRGKIIKKFDLLHVLEILLEELNVTAAGERLNLTQSAVSKHLAQLRIMFKDPLFERSGKGLRATPRAIELTPHLKKLLKQLDQIIQPVVFDPITSKRRFNIHLLESAYSLTFPFFMPQLLNKAPNIRLKTHSWNSKSFDALERCKVDMAITCQELDERSPLHMRSLPNTLSCVELLREKSVCLLREGHPALSQTWNLNTFLQYRHLQVNFGGLEHWLLDEVLTLQSLNRDVVVNMPDFHSAMSLTQQSDLILCAPSRHADQMADFYKLQTLEIPIKLEPGAYVLLWNKYFDNDSGHRWLRDLIIKSALR